MKGRIGLLWVLVNALIWTAAVPAYAVPAAPDFSTIVQPDGSIVDVLIQGDEWSNSIETREGYTVAKAEDGFWYYVMNYDNRSPALDSVKAHQPPPWGIQKHLHPRREARVLTSGMEIYLTTLAEAAPYGKFRGNILFILAEFSNRKGTYSQNAFASFLQSNIKDFYRKSSHGKVTLVPAPETSRTENNGVVGWVNLGYAHPNTAGDTDITNQRIAKDAILKADRYVNFKRFDTNNDGYVDSNELAVVVIVAGFERSYSAAFAPSVWGHKWSIGPAVGVPTVDGVKVGAYHNGAGGYAQFGEIHQSSSSDKHKATMGIMVHELGHLIFGLPDLYDTDYSSSGAGAFCVMSGGSWGKASGEEYAGTTPVLPGAWIRYDRGWVTAPAVTKTTTNITAAGAGAATSANTVFKRPTNLKRQFFLVENRQPLGYDKGLQRYLGARFGGIAIWHVDESMRDAENTNDFHRLVDLEEADGTQMGSGPGQKTDLWYVGNRTVFKDSSNPDSRLNNGNASRASIITKAEVDKVIKVVFGTSVTETTAFSHQFKGDTAPNWVAKTGRWIISKNGSGENDYYTSRGVANKWATALYNKTFSDHNYTVKVMRKSSSDIYSNCLFVRASGATQADGTPLNGYVFIYLRWGGYSVWKLVNGVATPLSPVSPNWPYTNAIKTGNAWNELRVVANGSSLSFYINGEPVWSGSDSSLSSGKVGVGFYRDASTTGDKLLVDAAILKTFSGLNSAPEDASLSGSDLSSAEPMAPVNMTHWP